jgi:uncharacterized membrane protein
MHAQAQEKLARGARWFGIGIGLGAAVAGITAAMRSRDRTVTVKTSVTIRREPEEVYRFWRDFSNLPRFMQRIESVSVNGAGRSRWCARGPAGAKVEWEADIVTDRPGDRIAWRSADDATIANHGAVLFRPASRGRGTEVHLTIGFEPPGGAVAAKILRLFEAVPEQQLKGDLRRLKQILETGEITRSDASIHRRTHSARPPALQQLPNVEGTVQP